MLEVRGRVSEEEDHGGRFKEGRSGKEGQVRRVRGCVLTLLGIETDEALGRIYTGTIILTFIQVHCTIIQVQ